MAVVELGQEVSFAGCMALKSLGAPEVVKSAFIVTAVGAAGVTPLVLFVSVLVVVFVLLLPPVPLSVVVVVPLSVVVVVLVPPPLFVPQECAINKNTAVPITIPPVFSNAFIVSSLAGNGPRFNDRMPTYRMIPPKSLAFP
jgi:hypothetical protein